MSRAEIACASLGISEAVSGVGEAAVTDASWRQAPLAVSASYLCLAQADMNLYTTYRTASLGRPPASGRGSPRLRFAQSWPPSCPVRRGSRGRTGATTGTSKTPTSFVASTSKEEGRAGHHWITIRAIGIAEVAQTPRRPSLQVAQRDRKQRRVRDQAGRATDGTPREARRSRVMAARGESREEAARVMASGSD